jgi:hypothetical protein
MSNLTQVTLVNGVPQESGTVSTLDALLAVTAKESGGNLAAILAKLSADPATQTTLAALVSANHTDLGVIATALATNHTDEVQLHTDIATTLIAKDEAIRALLAGTLTTAPAAGENHIGEVGGNSAVVGGSFTRPADTTPYTLGDIVANNTSGASVTPISCAVARKNQGTGEIVRVRLSKTNTSLTNASFRVHLLKTSPTLTNGDNAALAGAINGVAAVEIGYVDITMDQQYSDGAKGFAAISPMVFDAASASQNIYAIIEARAAYTPGNAETFTLALEVLRD